MKIVEELMEAMLRRQEAQAEVDRLSEMLRRKVDGRGKGARKPRQKRVVKKAD